MTSLPDWLVERAALDEVPAQSRDRIDRADPQELATRIATLRDANAAELAKYPAAPAVTAIEARVAATVTARADRRRRRMRVLGLAASVASIVVVVLFVTRSPKTETTGVVDPDTEITRIKGNARLIVFRNSGDHAEKLDEDALVREGDLIQIRYNPGGKRHGLIASVDGAGVVTLHYPASEDAPAAATAVASETTSLPNAYALDDAPTFERFFFITANTPIDVQQSLAVLRNFARRTDSATAPLELPAGFHQWSLRLRKPDVSK